MKYTTSLYSNLLRKNILWISCVLQRVGADAAGTLPHEIVGTKPHNEEIFISGVPFQGGHLQIQYWDVFSLLSFELVGDAQKIESD